VSELDEIGYNLRSGRTRNSNRQIGKVNDVTFSQAIRGREHVQSTSMTGGDNDDGSPNDMMHRVVNYVFTEVPERYTQVSTKKGFRVFGERAVEALLAEYK